MRKLYSILLVLIIVSISSAQNETSTVDKRLETYMKINQMYLDAMKTLPLTVQAPENLYQNVSSAYLYTPAKPSFWFSSFWIYFAMYLCYFISIFCGSIAISRLFHFSGERVG